MKNNNIITIYLQNILLLITIAVQFILLFNCYYDISHQKFNFVAIVELSTKINDNQDLQKLSLPATAEVKLISSDEIKNYQNSFAPDTQLELTTKLVIPSAIILSFLDLPQNINNQLQILTKSDTIKNLYYSSNLLNKITDIQHFITKIIKYFAVFVIISSILSILHICAQCRYSHLFSIKNIAFLTFGATVIANLIIITIVKKINICCQDYGLKLQLHLYYPKLILLSTLLIIITTLTSIIFHKIFREQWNSN